MKKYCATSNIFCCTISLSIVRYLLLFAFVMILLAGQGIALSYAENTAAPASLKQEINEKAKALLEVNQKIIKAQNNLEETESKGKTLQNEIQSFDYKISQLNLNIRASKLNIGKLGLEIKSLKYEIANVKNQLDLKKNAVAALLNNLHKKDSETTLAILLRNKSLAKSFDELQSIVNFNKRLSIEVTELSSLNSELEEKLHLTSVKKSDIELESKNLKNRKVIVGSQKNKRKLLLAQTKNQEKAYQRLMTNLEKQQSAIAAEIEKLEEKLRLTIDPTLLPTPRPGVLKVPVKGRLTQGYGNTKFARWAYKGRWHNGIDFGAPIGTPIFSAEDGIVLEIWNQDRYCPGGAYGRFIVIEHNNNLTTLYAHLSLFSGNIKRGDSVQRGDLIGYVGSSGYATGPHLHFTVYASQTFRIGSSKVNCGPKMPYGGDLDPRSYLAL